MGLLTDRLCTEHTRLMPHVDDLRVIADEAGTLSREAVQERLEEEHAFLTAELLPHVSAVQETLYPAFERLLQNRHSMSPLSREHDQIRRLLSSMSQLASTPATGRSGPGTPWLMEVRRMLYHLYALLKVHLAEEEMYTPILEHELTEAQLAAIVDALETKEAALA